MKIWRGGCFHAGQDFLRCTKKDDLSNSKLFSRGLDERISLIFGADDLDRCTIITGMSSRL